MFQWTSLRLILFLIKHEPVQSHFVLRLAEIIHIWSDETWIVAGSFEEWGVALLVRWNLWKVISNHFTWFVFVFLCWSQMLLHTLRYFPFRHGVGWGLLHKTQCLVNTGKSRQKSALTVNAFVVTRLKMEFVFRCWIPFSQKGFGINRSWKSDWIFIVFKMLLGCHLRKTFLKAVLFLRRRRNNILYLFCTSQLNFVVVCCHLYLFLTQKLKLICLNFKLRS